MTSRAGSVSSSPCDARDRTALDNSQPPARLLEGGHREIEIVLRVGCGDLAPHSGLALWDDGIPESRDEHTFLEERIAHLDRRGSFTHDDRDDRSLSRQRFE